jgi:hypothetical protein
MRGFFTAIFIFAFSSSVVAQNFSELSRSQILDFKESWRQLYVLGVPDGGLVKEQRFRLEDLFDFYLERPADLENLSKEFDYLFYYPSSLLELSQNFERHHASRLPNLYLMNLGHLKIENPNFQDVLRSLLLQIQIREELIRFPLLADSQFLAGLNADDRLHFYQLQALKESEIRILEEIAIQNLVAREDFFKVAEVFGIQREALESVYLDYLYLGRLPRHREVREEEFRQHFLETDQTLDRTESEYSEQVDFYWQLYSASHRALWRLQWEDLWIKKPEDSWIMTGNVWIETFLSQKWSGFQTASNLTAPELIFKIKDYVDLSGSFSDRDRQRFADSLFSLQTLGKLPDRDLPTEIRTLLAVAAFPFMPLRDAFILLDKNFEYLPLHEQEKILWRMPLSIGERMYWHERLHQISSHDLAALRVFENDLTLSLLEAFRLEIESAESETVELLDGQRLASSASLRSQMRQIIDGHGPLDYGVFPRWLIDSLMIHLFPSPDYWRLEWSKAKNEWRRLNFIEKHAGRGLSEQDLMKIQEILFDENKQPKTDYSSPLVYLSSWTHGAVSDPSRLIPAILMGAGFHLVFRSLGGKLVCSVLFGDAGLRIGSAYFFEESSKSWYEVPVNQLIWTPGQMVAEELQHIGRLGKSLIFPQDSPERLWAFRDLGRYSTEILGFGIGAIGLEMALPWSRLIHLRSIRHQHREIQKLTDQRRQLLDLEGSVMANIQQAEFNHWSRQTLHSKDRLKKLIDRENTWHRLLRLEARWLSERRGLWGRLTHGMLSIARWGTKIYGLLPIKLPQWKSLKIELQNWKLRRSKSLLQMDRQIKTIQSKLTALEQASLVDIYPALRKTLSSLQEKSMALEKRLSKLKNEFDTLFHQLAQIEATPKASGIREIKAREERVRSLSSEMMRLLDDNLALVLSLNEMILASPGYRQFWISLFDRSSALKKTTGWRNEFHQIQLESAVSFQRFQFDSYLMLRDQFHQWRLLWHRYTQQRRLHFPNDEGFLVHLMRDDSRIQSRFLAADSSFSSMIQNLRLRESGLSEVVSRRIFDLDEYLKLFRDQRIFSDRARLQPESARDLKLIAIKISDFDLPVELKKFGSAAEIWKSRDQDWVHYLIENSTQSFILSGRIFAGRFRVFNRIDVLPQVP